MDWISVLVGLLTGAISSYCVTRYWQYKMDIRDKAREFRDAERTHSKDFSNDIQTLCRYLDHVELELVLPSNQEKNSCLRRLVDAQPATPSFSNGMTEVGTKIMSDLFSILRELDNDAEHDNLSDQKCIFYRGRLFMIECELLKKQRQIQMPWNEYVQKNPECLG